MVLYYSGTEKNSNNNTDPDFNCSVKSSNIFSPKHGIKSLQNPCVSGIDSSMFRCNRKICNFQLDCYISENEVSSVTKRLYDCVTPPGKFI